MGAKVEPPVQDPAPGTPDQDMQPQEAPPQSMPAPEELASADGVEVTDEEFEWPEKDADASSGWWDHRGDFYEY